MNLPLKSKRGAMPIAPTSHPLARDVTFSGDAMCVVLVDGRSLHVPLAWQPELDAATQAQRAHFEMLGSGAVIYWPSTDTYLSVRRLLVPDGATH